MYKTLSQWVAGVILIITSVGAANAVTVNYTGVVDILYAGNTSTAAVGSVISGSFTYDPYGNGVDAVTAASFSLDGGAANAYDMLGAVSNVSLGNTGTNDTFGASWATLLGDFQFTSVQDNTGTTFTGTGNSLLQTLSGFTFNFPPSTGLFDLFYFDGVTTYDFGGYLTSLTAVPEPSILALLGLGLLGMVYGRRKVAE